MEAITTSNNNKKLLVAPGITTSSKKLLGAIASRLEAITTSNNSKKLLVAPGITTSSKKLLGAIASRLEAITTSNNSKKLLVAPGITTSSKKLLGAIASRLEAIVIRIKRNDMSSSQTAGVLAVIRKEWNFKEPSWGKSANKITTYSTVLEGNMAQTFANTFAIIANSQTCGILPTCPVKRPFTKRCLSKGFKPSKACGNVHNCRNYANICQLNVQSRGLQILACLKTDTRYTSTKRTNNHVLNESGVFVVSDLRNYQDVEVRLVRFAAMRLILHLAKDQGLIGDFN